jgi:hypothetical protein
MLGVRTSFIASVSSGTRHSIAHTIPHGATLTVEVPGNLNDVFPLFLALIPFSVRPRVMHLHANRSQEAETDAAVADRLRLLISDLVECDRAAGRRNEINSRAERAFLSQTRSK